MGQQQDALEQQKASLTQSVSAGIHAVLRVADWRRHVVYYTFAAVFLLFAITQSGRGFLTPTNLVNTASQGSIIAVYAVMMTFVLAAGEIDISIGSVAGLSSVVAAMVIPQWGTGAGIAAGLMSGLVVGAINAFCVTVLDLPSFLVTLGTMVGVEGFAEYITNEAPVPIQDPIFNGVFGSADLGPVSVLIVWALMWLVVGYVVLHLTPFGRHTLATGGNLAAARELGINTRTIKVAVLLMSSFGAAFVGLLYAGELQGGRFQWGEGDALWVIAAVVLGGTSLYGGKASPIGAAVGALLLSLIRNGLVLMGLQVSEQDMILGLLVIASLSLGRRR